MNINSNTIVKEIVASNFQSAKVFEKYGIDFCCKGNRPLNEAAEERKINVSELIGELVTVSKSNGSESEKYYDWDLVFLSTYIVNTHHAYVKEAIPRIQTHLEKVENRHGKTHQYMIEVNDLFKKISNEMISHMFKEEKVLFPLIKYLSDCQSFLERPKTGGYKTIKNPIFAMEQEHSGAGNILEQIRRLTDNFKLPEDACTTFTLTYKELEEFEQDLHKHVHLENNILFPKAIKLEEELLNYKKL
ncbi:MAG: iron-sulfur cluster repair di-iron protein [Ignavibacteria bacterium GWB2_35_6b]|nr:MAG: iron-sulfur cluster repair di-iron protein [Ignavibacteria bacterium GWB2_35_6b]